jgi:hypothetical protein
VTVACFEHVLREGPRTVRVKREGTEPPLWRVAPGLGLRIRTVDQHGTPLPRALLLLLRPGMVPPLFPYASDERGLFDSPRDLAPGHYTVRPVGGLRASALEVDLTPDVALREVELRYEGAGSLVVDVRGKNQQPVDTISVYAEQIAADGESARAISVVYGVPVALGRMRIGPLLPGRYRVRVDDGTNPPVAVGGDSVSFAGGDQSLQVQLPSPATLRGRVESANGEPLPSVWVTAKYIATTPARATPWQRPSRVLSDDDGTFVLESLVAGASYELRAELPGGTELVARDVRPGSPLVMRADTPGQ